MERLDADHGLPQNTVCGIVVDAGGYAWVATEGGLVRFDGRTAQHVDMPSVDGRTDRLREILQLHDGAIAIRDGWDREFLLEHGRVVPNGPLDIDRRPYPARRGTIPSRAIHAYIVRNLRNGTPYYSPDDLFMGVMTVNAHEWVASSDTGLLHFRDTTLVDIIPYVWRYDYLFTIGDRLFGLGEAHEPFRLDLRTHTRQRIAFDGPPGMDTTRCHANGWWRTNDTGPSLFIDGKLYTLSTTAAGDTLRATLLDLPYIPRSLSATWVDEPNGLVLLGTRDEGLLIYRRSVMRTVRSNEAQPGRRNVFYAQAPWGDAHVITMAGTSPRVFSIAGWDSTATVPIDSFNSEGVLADSKGRYWYGLGNLICRYDTATGERWSTPCGQGTRTRVRAFCEEGDSMWVTTGAGIGHVRKGTFHSTCVFQDRSYGDDAICIRRGPDERLWYASCAGAYRLDAQGGAPTPVRGSEGHCVRALQRIGQRMYIGTYGSGPWVFTNDTLRRLPIDPLGYLAHVHAFMPDGLGFLWLSTNHGLFRVGQRDIDAYLDGTDTLLYYAYYGRSAGIRNQEFNGGCDPAYVRLPNGYASFPSLDGLVWFKPEAIPDPYPTAPIRLDELLLDGRSIADSGTISLDPEKHELIVRFSVAYWGDAPNLQLAYKLPGFQDGWYRLGADQRELRFQHLPHGSYTLTVRKLGMADSAGRGDLVLHFVVRKPYYLSAWFLAACVATTIGAGVLVFRLYQARLRTLQQALLHTVRTRTADLERANDRLERSIAVKERLAAIISHDIVAPLRSIANVAHQAPRRAPEAHRRELARTLTDIASSSEKLYLNARNLLNWIKHQGGHVELRPTHVALNPLVEEAISAVVPLVNGRAMRVVNNVPFDDVLLTDRELLGIVVQNLLNDALDRGQDTQVTVSGEQLPDAYRLVVAKDGADVPAAVSDASDGNSAGRSTNGSSALGLDHAIISELVQLMGGEIQQEEGPEARIAILLNPLTDAQRSV
jgi:signal transduction histidine kinase